MAYKCCHPATNSGVFVCECGSLAHMFLVTTTDEGTYLQVFLEHEPILDRIKTAWSLIRGRRRKYGDFEDILIREEDLRMLRMSFDLQKKWTKVSREDTFVRLYDEFEEGGLTFGHGLIAELRPNEDYDEHLVEDNQLIVVLEYRRDKSFWSRLRLSWNHLLHGRPTKHMGDWVDFTLSQNDERLLFDAFKSAEERYNKLKENA